MAGPTILLSAGEPSGDLHGAAVARALRRRWPEARLFGLGGPRMAEAGVELMADPRKLAVMGFVEVASRLPYFWRLFHRVRSAMVSRHADLVLPIDYPGFNLRLAREARAASIPVLYYIAPQVWAWHRSRLRQLARDTDRLAVVLPFEEAIFREAGAAAQFVGHPLLDVPPPGSRQSLCRQLNIEEHRPILALFPGSRAQEVGRHLALFVKAAQRIQANRPEVQPVVAVSGAVSARAYERAPYPRTPDSWDLLWHARAALVKSGTTTLEAALAGTPMAIVYRMHPLSYRLARRLVRVDHIGLVNLVAGERLAPEFVQHEATPASLAAAMLPLLRSDRSARAEAVEGLGRVRSALEPPRGGSDRVAERVVDLAAELLQRPV